MPPHSRHSSRALDRRPLIPDSHTHGLLEEPATASERARSALHSRGVHACSRAVCLALAHERACFHAQVFADPVVLQWAVGLLLLQVVLQGAFSLSSSPKLAENAGPVAHQLCVFIPFCVSSYYGTKLMFFDDEIAAMSKATFVERLYGFHPTTWYVTRFFAGFQVYDLCAIVLVPELRKLEHGAHHVLSLLTACAGMSGPFLQFYCPFFFGFVEVSSMPLAWVDLFRRMEPAAGTIAGALNEFVRIAFAVSFLPIRCIMFPYFLLFYFYPDLYAASAAGDFRGPVALGYFALSSMLLCSMQARHRPPNAPIHFWIRRRSRPMVSLFALPLVRSSSGASRLCASCTSSSSAR